MSSEHIDPATAAADVAAITEAVDPPPTGTVYAWGEET
jgi:hypothetical protein